MTHLDMFRKTVLNDEDWKMLVTQLQLHELDEKGYIDINERDTPNKERF